MKFPIDSIVVFLLSILFTLFWIDKSSSPTFVYILAIIGVAVFIPLYSFSPHVIVYLFIASLFVNIPIIDNYPIRFYLSDFLMLPLFLYFLSVGNTEGKRVNYTILMLMLFHLLTAFISFLINFSDQDETLIWTSLLGVGRILQVIFLYVLSIGRLDLDKKVIFLIVFILTVIQFPISLFVTQYNSHEPFLMHGTFGTHHSALGTFMVITFYIGFLYFRESKNLLFKSLSATLMAISFVMLLFSQSRSALLGLFASFILLFFTSFKIKFKYIFTSFIILLLTILVVSNTPLSYVFEKTFNRHTGMDPSSLSRPVIWHDSIKHFSKQKIITKLFGHGIELSRAKMSISIIQKHKRFITSSHNNFLTALVETGIIGFWAFVILYGYIWFYMWKSYRIKNDNYSYTFLLLHTAFLVSCIPQETFWVQAFVITSLMGFYMFLSFVNFQISE